MLPRCTIVCMFDALPAEQVGAKERRSGGIGVALGGGAARGAAHVGALQALEDAGLRADCVAGTSYGAIIAALYALGGPAAELERVIRQQDIGELWSQAIDFGLHRGAFVNGKRLARWLDRKFFYGATFADTQIPLAIACTDLETGDLAVMSEGSLADAVRASCALPAVFAPVKLAGRVLIDGGFVEAVPFRALATLEPRLSIGIHAGVDTDKTTFVRMIRRVNRSATGRALKRAAAATSATGPLGQALKGVSVSFESYEHRLTAPPGAHLLVTEPRIAWWDFHRSPQAFEAGRVSMRGLIQQLGPAASAAKLEPVL